MQCLGHPKHVAEGRARASAQTPPTYASGKAGDPPETAPTATPRAASARSFRPGPLSPGGPAMSCGG